MSNKKCAICQDLLALYVDGLCSEESGEFIEEHFSECERCKVAFSDMKKECVSKGISNEEKQSGDEFKMKLGRRWSRFKKKMILKITAIVLAVVALLGTGFYFAFFHYFYIPPEYIKIDDLCRLSDGRIAFSLTDYEGKNVTYLRHSLVDDELYLTVESIIMNNNHPKELRGYDYVDIDLIEDLGDFETNAKKIKAIYYGEYLGDNILIWQEGMEIPEASEWLEEHFEGLSDVGKDFSEQEMLESEQ